MTKKQLVVVNDLHAGSIFSPCTKRFKTSIKTIYKPNKYQKYATRCWGACIDEMPLLDYLIFNGDMTDGPKPGKNGIPLFEHHPIYQARLAVELCEPLKAKLKPGGEIHCTEGTEYHEGDRSEASELFAEMIGATPAYDGHYAWDWLLLEIDGITLDIHHAQSYHTVYRTTPLMRELDHSLLRTAKFEEPTVYGIIRGHTHSEWTLVEEGLRTAIAVPAWQIQTRYARKSKTPNRTISQWIGSALIEIDADRLKENDSPVRCIKKLYKHPKKKRVKR